MEFALTIALALGAAFVFGVSPERSSLAGWRLRWGRLLVPTFAVLGVVCYVAPAVTAPRGFVHSWDIYHYYLGSKYFREVGYERLYACTSVATMEDGQVPPPRMTDLATNEIISTAATLARPTDCTDHFTPERWIAFRRDVAFFRSSFPPLTWSRLVLDHGFNASPVWTMVGGTIANAVPLSKPALIGLATIDVVLLALLAALVGWAFGARTLTVMVIALGAYLPQRIGWTSGAFLRQDWLLFTVASICLLKKGRPFLAGCALAYAGCLRLFPFLLLVGPIAAVTSVAIRERRFDRRWLKLFTGTALGTFLLVASSLAVTGGPAAYEAFARNTAKHAASPMTNVMGLPTALAYRPSTASWRAVAENDELDPYRLWKEAHRDASRSSRPLVWIIGLAFIVVLERAARKSSYEPWMTTAMGAIAIGLFAELLCYYYAFIAVLVLLHARRAAAGVVFLVLAATTQFLAWAPVPHTQLLSAERFVAFSVVTLCAFAALLLVFTENGDGASDEKA